MGYTAHATITAVGQTPWLVEPPAPPPSPELAALIGMISEANARSVAARRAIEVKRAEDLAFFLGEQWAEGDMVKIRP